MEKKYIEVNELLKSFTPDYSVYSSDKPIRIDLRLIKRIITRQPIADVAEVKHGKWKLHSDGSGTCNVCGKLQNCIWDMDNWQNFCGHCGADMRGE